MIYISSHPEMFYKNVFLKLLQNSQENSWARVYSSCTFNKKEALAQVVSCESSEIDVKIQKVNACKIF